MNTTMTALARGVPTNRSKRSVIEGGMLAFLLLAPTSVFADLISSDELRYTLGKGVGTLFGNFHNLNPKIFENGIIPENPANVRAKLLVTWDPARGLVAPKLLVLTEEDGTVSDIFKLSVNVDSSLLTFEFTSDGETGLVDPQPNNSIKIPEAGDSRYEEVRRRPRTSHRFLAPSLSVLWISW